MTKRNFRTRHAGVACSFMLCAACGSTPPADNATDVASAANLYQGTQPVYAELTQERGGSWVFTTVTASDAPAASGYLVRLNDLAPAFDTRVAECVPQVYPDAHRCSPTNPFRDKDAGLVNKIINGGIAVGTAGKVTELSQSYETSFDQAAFNGAVDEALVNTGLDRNRLIVLVDSYADEVELARAEAKEMAQHAANTHSRTQDIQLEISPVITGLSEYYERDIDFASLVRLDVASDLDIATVNIAEKALLPCTARQCVANAEVALADLRQNVASHTDRLTAMSQPTARVYRVNCTDVADDTYLLELECPDQVAVTSDNTARLEVGVNILARDFEQLFPAFVLGDDALQVSIDGNTATFSNATSEYLTVTAQTVYYNSQAHTTALNIDVPPGIAVTHDLGKFISPAIGIESSYRSMTPDKAAAASFQFGFAVRYRSASQAEEQTLHSVQTYNVGCVIRNRIEPGSCRAEKVAEVESNQPSQSRKETSYRNW